MAVTFTFDGTAQPADLIVRDIRRPILGASRDTFVDIPGRDGSWFFEDRRGDREISMTLAVNASSAANRRTALSSLASLLNRTGKRQLIFSDEPDRFWLGRFTDWSEPNEVRGWAELDCTFRAEPWSYSTSASTQSLAAGTTQPYSSTLTVTTDYDTPWIVDITPSGAALTNGFTLTVNGDALTVGTTVPAGQVCQINAVSYTVTINGTLAMSAVSGTFARLVNGTNTVTFSRASGTASTDLTFQWRRRFA